MALDPLTAILDVGGKILDKIFPDKTEAQKAQVVLAQLAQAGQLQELASAHAELMGQLEINKVEAASEKWWVAGWRPFIGWICGVAVAYNYIIQPFLAWLLNVLGNVNNMPALDTGELMTLLLGMLGLGAMRSYEKTMSGKK